MAVSLFASGVLRVTGMTIFQTPEAQAPAASQAVGTRAYDVDNGRTFVVSTATGADPQRWVLETPWLIPSWSFGNGTATVSGVVRVLDPFFADRAASAGPLNAGTFATLPGLTIERDARISGFRVRRTPSGAGTITGIGLYINGTLIGTAINLGAGVNTALATYVSPVNVSAGQILQCAGTFGAGTSNNLVVQAVGLPPAG